MNALETEKIMISSSKFLEAVYSPSDNFIICTTKSEYIPMEDFQNHFNAIGSFIKKNKTVKFIFDKTSLKVFHQPSMEWYHTVWKKEMANYGLKSYRKILPNLQYFKMSVKIGKERIVKENPDFKFEDYDIQYYDTLKEALLY
jgi:hypothetical protein